MSVVDERTEPRWTMKGNVLPDRDFFIEALRKEEETGGEGPRFEKLVKHSQPHCMQYLFSFFAICFSRSRVSLDHYVLSMYPPHALLTYCSQVHRVVAWTLGSSGELN